MIATEQELITLTVDDQEVSVPPGTNLVETAKELGTEVPVFCYHSRLPVVGACRMCLVAVELPPRPGTPPDAPATAAAHHDRLHHNGDARHEGVDGHRRPS